MRTKFMLGILAHSDGITMAEFGSLARAFGVAPDNVEMTLNAILQTGCAQVTEGKVIPTPWGQRYVRFGLQLAVARNV